MKEDLLLSVVVAVIAAVIFWVMRILFGQVVFEPYIVSQMFSIAVALFFVMVVEDVKDMAWGWALALAFIIAFAFSVEMYWIADMMNASQLEYHNSMSWETCPSSPYLPNITWGWRTQSIISAVIATIHITIVVIYKITVKEKKVEAE